MTTRNRRSGKVAGALTEMRGADFGKDALLY